MKEDMRNSKRKIPGMLYILVSFVPWIIYWVLCGMGNKLGIIIPLVISLLLIIPRIRKKDFNIMDITSSLYFCVATVVTFALKLDVFVEKSGLLGYSVLFLMALFSLIIKQPYTLQVARRDYPKIYWKDKTFLAINNLITIAWVVIFLLNAVIFWLLGHPLTVVLSTILTAFGIAFSIVFPMKTPGYLISREFKKYDWNVKVDPQKTKKDEYDVIIVGSGIGSLSCGALLSNRGYKILILEQHHLVGGYCTSFRRKEFTFNSGVEDISGLWEKGPVSYLLKKVGLEKEDLFVRNRTRYIYKGKEIDANNLEDFVKLLSGMFPHEKENISVFFDDAQKAYEECYQDAQIYGAPLSAELIVKVFGEKKLLEYPKERPHFYDWLSKTYRQKLDEYFEDEDLKTLLFALLGYVGTKPDKTLASNALTACVAYYLYGGYFPKGGAQKFADSLKQVIENHGGRVLTKHKVDKILVKNGAVTGVKVDDETFKSPVVVSNVNAKTTFLGLVGENNLDKEYAECVKGLKMSTSSFMVFLGVDMNLSNHPTLIKSLDEGYSIAINSNADQSLAPSGKASVTILTGASYNDFPKRGTKGYKKKKKQVAEMLIQKAESVIPNLSKHIILQDAATPKTFERYTSMPEGAIYAFDQSTDTIRPSFKTPIRGLYLVGASTFPGGGIEAVVMSGIICANDICNWKSF
jgi:all-trans-retinol 13,14-reductase